MIRFLMDENMNGNVVEGVRRTVPEIDILTASEAGLLGQRDPQVLAWAAENDRVVLTNDVKTMIAFAKDRVHQDLRMPGIIVIRANATIGDAIEAIILLNACSDHSECNGQVIYIPFPEALRKT